MKSIYPNGWHNWRKVKLKDGDQFKLEWRCTKCGKTYPYVALLLRPQPDYSLPCRVPLEIDDAVGGG